MSSQPSSRNAAACKFIQYRLKVQFSGLNKIYRFLLARYHVERIMGCISTAEIWHCLETLPDKLDDHYEQAWRRATSEGNPHRRKQAYLTLMWIILAEQPLSLPALHEAVAISMGIDSGLRGSTATSMNDVIALCAGIITIEGCSAARRDTSNQEVLDLSNAKVLVVHASASEYFYTRQNFYFPTGHEIITKTCAHVIKSAAIEPYWAAIPLSSLVPVA